MIIYYTDGVKTARMAEAVERWARDALKEAESEGDVQVIVKRAAQAGPEDLLAADALVLGTPENFGYMSGMMKDFLERVFYPCKGKVEGRPWAMFIGAGQAGSGAPTSVERIVTGLRMREAHEPDRGSSRSGMADPWIAAIRYERAGAYQGWLA